MAEIVCPPDVVLAGTSIRAMAQSAWRVGLRVWAIDRFGDRDTREIAVTWWRLPARPGPRFVEWVDSMVPSVPMCWGSPFENYPDVVRRLARGRPVWGADPEAVRLVRSPEWLAGVLKGADIGYPRVLDEKTVAGAPVVLEKPYRSGGGLGIRVVDPAVRRRPAQGHYWQEYIEGRPVSGLFWSSGVHTVLLFAAEQLIGLSEFGARPWGYCGGIGPIELTGPVRVALERAGCVIARESGLRGLFGVDCVLRGSELFVLEVNPRWTASVELYELATGVNAFQLHTSAFVPETSARVAAAAGGPLWGRAILYAKGDTVVRSDAQRLACRTAGGQSWWLADIPRAGVRLKAGEPALSVYCRGHSVEEVRGALRALAEHVYRTLLQ